MTCAPPIHRQIMLSDAGTDPTLFSLLSPAVPRVSTA
jgi:hypothetical protein